jgi:hypothetical protein
VVEARGRADACGKWFVDPQLRIEELHLDRLPVSERDHGTPMHLVALAGARTSVIRIGWACVSVGVATYRSKWRAGAMTIGN